MSKFIKTHKIIVTVIVAGFVLLISIIFIQAQNEKINGGVIINNKSLYESALKKVTIPKQLDIYKKNIDKHVPGVGYYDAVKVLHKILKEKYKTISFDKLTIDSNSRHGLTNLNGLRQAINKNGLYSAAVKISFDELKELIREYDIITVVGANRLYSQVLSIEENGVKVFIPGFANSEYLMPTHIFKRDWDGKVILMSNREINIDKSKLISENDLLLGDGCGNAYGDVEIPFDTSTMEPVIIRSGKLRTWSRDIFIPHPKTPLEIKRYYNASIESEVNGWQPDRAYGSSWSIEDGEYSGQGHITVTRNIWNNPTIIVDMKTQESGQSLVEVGCINFCYTDLKNRYSFFIAQDGSLFIGKFVNSLYPTYIVDGWSSNLNPLEWNTVMVEYNNGNIKVYINGGLKIDVTDTSPLPQGRVGLESHLSHSHFDNLTIQDSTQTQINDFTEDDNEFIFGYGWTYTYGIMVKEFYNEFAIVYRPDGRKDRFINNGDGTYTSPLRIYDTLTKTVNGYTLREKNGTEHHFDLTGKLLDITDTNNNQITINCELIDGKEKPSTITNSFGQTINFEYGANGMVSKITDDLGRETQYGYDGDRLASVTDARGNNEIYTYYALSGNLNTITDKEGNTYTHTYLYNDQVNTQIDPLGNVTYFDYLGGTTVVTNNKLESFSYDFYSPPRPLIASITDRKWQMAIFTWDKNANIASRKDRNNNTIYYTWSNKGDLTSIDIPGEEYPDRCITNYTYDPSYNKITSITDANGNNITLEYDPSNGNLLKIKAPPPLNYETTFTYYGNGLLHKKTDAKGNVTEYFYDEYGYLEKIVEPLGKTTYYQYNTGGKLISFTDANGNTTSYEYDNNNNLIKVISPDPFNYEKIYGYNKNDKLVETILPNGAKTTYEYDAIDNLITLNKYLDSNTIHTTTYTYDTTNFMEQGVSNLLGITDANGNTTSYKYDKNNRPVKTTDADGNSTFYKYDNENNIIKITDANGNYTRYAYSGYNRLIGVNYMDGTVENYDYDSVGNVINKIDRNGNMTIYTYDVLNRLTQKTFSDGKAVSYQYDEPGNLESVTDINGTINYIYDGLNRITSVIYPDGNTVNYQYDNVGNRIKLTYPDNTYITYHYDNLNRLMDIKNASSQIIAHYTHDNVSRRTQLDILNGTGTTYQYDNLNRLTQFTNIYSPLQDTYNYTYDNVGNCITMSNHEGSHLYSYDSLYRLNQVTYPDGKTISYTSYDNVGNRLSRDRDGIQTTYTYNDVNQLLNYTNNGGVSGNKITVRGRVTDNHLSSVTVNNIPATLNVDNFTVDNIPLTEGENTITAVAVDGGGNSTQQSIKVNHASIKEVNFSYDNNGNVTQKNVNGKITNYTYDYENRLIQVELSPEQWGSFWRDDFNPKKPGWRDNTTDPGWDCVIDDNGRIQVVDNDPGWGHVYSPLLEVNVDQYPIVTVDIASVDPGPYTNFTLEIQDYYGPAKTWVSQATSPGTYSVDLNQLMGWSETHRFYISIWVGGGAGKGINLNYVSVGAGTITKTVEFKYDPFGRRIEKKVITNSIPETTKYIYDGAHIIQETGAIPSKYIYGPRIDEPISLTKQGNPYYYHFDRLGSVIALTDQTGSLIERYEYDPFGKPLNTSTIGNRLMFTGREWDSETGMYYYRTRYYDPEVGRFISADPLTWSPNDPRPRGFVRSDPLRMRRLVSSSSEINTLTWDIVFSNLVRSTINAGGLYNPTRLHLYTYVNNNPVNWLDPWGLCRQLGGHEQPSDYSASEIGVPPISTGVNFPPQGESDPRDPNQQDYTPPDDSNPPDPIPIPIF